MSKIVFIVLAAATVLAVSTYIFTAHHNQDLSEHELLWSQFKTQHNKRYGADEEKYRLNVFKQNLERIRTYQEGDPGAKYGVTSLADLTQEEFRTNKLGLNKPSGLTNLTDTERNAYKSNLTDIPESVDWRTLGAVTPVKNQGDCGSCWAFSTIQNIEGAHAVKNKQLFNLSEQQLIDCDKVDTGCEGGYMQQGMTWLSEHGGISLESDYPYIGLDQNCSFDKSKAAVQVTGYKNISSDEAEIAKAVAELGPLAIAVDADPWQFYLGGISNPFLCYIGINHGVLLVGYGSGRRYIGETDYWIIKNSWGTGWGESGYIRLVRGKGVCLMNTDVSTVTVA